MHPLTRKKIVFVDPAHAREVLSESIDVAMVCVCARAGRAGRHERSAGVLMSAPRKAGKAPVSRGQSV